MTESVNIAIKRTGFPVKIGEIELWFDSSAENLKRFINIDEIAKKRLEEVKEKTKHVHFPEEINEETMSDVDSKDVDTAFNAKKEFIAIQYDLLFENGTFKNIYKQYPDILALELALETIGEAITDKVEEEEKERSKKFASHRKKLLDKKKQKQK